MKKILYCILVYALYIDYVSAYVVKVKQPISTGEFWGLVLLGLIGGPILSGIGMVIGERNQIGNIITGIGGMAFFSGVIMLIIGIIRLIF